MEIDNITDVVSAKDIGVIEKFMKELPEKALNIGIRVLMAAVFLFVGIKLIKLVRKILKKSLLKGNVDLGVIQFLDSLVNAVLMIILIVLIASGFGVDATSIVAVVGSAGVAVGLALQGSLSNLAGGVLILILKPFKVGDYVKEDNKGHEGIVTEIHIFYTKLRTIDNTIIVLPNGKLADSGITNISMLPERRIDLQISVSYNSDLKKAKEIIMNLMKRDEATIENDDSMPFQVFVDNLGESDVVIGARCWVYNEDYWETKWRITENIKLELEKNGISIPYNQIDVHVIPDKVKESC